MLLIGIALIIVVVYLKENNNDDFSFTVNDTVVWGSVCIGSLIIIVSFLGCVGVCMFYIFIFFNISLHSFYIFFLTLLIFRQQHNQNVYYQYL